MKTGIIIFIAALALGLGCCSFSPDLGDSSVVPCLPDGSCQMDDCMCLGGRVCVPLNSSLPGEYCLVCTADSDCDDGLECTRDSCNLDSGRCLFSPGVEGSAFDGTCSNGLDDDCDGQTDGADPDCLCIGCPCTIDAQCGQGNPCALGVCVSGECAYNFALPNSPCPGSDGELCTSTCDGQGSCLDGVAVECHDINWCVTSHCVPESGLCESRNRSDGMSCLGDDELWCNSSCQSGYCQEGIPALAGEYCPGPAGCTVDDSCDGQGNCLAGLPDDSECLSGQVCLPQCSPANHGCLVPPQDSVLSCAVGIGENGERVAECLLDLGLEGQTGCLTCFSSNPAVSTAGGVQELSPGQYSFQVHQNLGNPDEFTPVLVTCEWANVRPDVKVSVDHTFSFGLLSISENFETGLEQFVFLDASTWAIGDGVLSTSETCGGANLAVVNESGLVYPMATVKVRADDLCAGPGSISTVGILAHMSYNAPPSCSTSSAYVCGIDYTNNLLFGGKMVHSCAGTVYGSASLDPLSEGSWYEIGIQVAQGGEITCFYESGDADAQTSFSWSDDQGVILEPGAVGLGVGDLSASFDDLYIEYTSGG